jgi:biotin carboxyl carrier protein
MKVNVGDAVNENDEVIILEAMKMELPVVATASGTVKEVKCEKGAAVEAEAVLIVLE